MSENIFTSFDISSKGLSIQRMRLNAVSKNIANINTTRASDGKPYKREVIIVQAIENEPFVSQLKNEIDLYRTGKDHSPMAKPMSEIYNESLQIDAKRAVDNSPPRLVYEPSHPDANEDGYVALPNINIVTEMVEMISAQRAFEANVQVIDSAKNIARYSLEI